ncbi:MAG: type II toxin-antitoxin system HicA family toxin [Dehalococcoidia bacterium]
MRLPRNEGGQELAKRLERLGYHFVRQVGSHMRLSDGANRLTVPDHRPVRVGTLNKILRKVEEQKGLTREEVLKTLWG